MIDYKCFQENISTVTFCFTGSKRKLWEFQRSSNNKNDVSHYIKHNWKTLNDWLKQISGKYLHRYVSHHLFQEEILVILTPLNLNVKCSTSLQMQYEVIWWPIAADFRRITPPLRFASHVPRGNYGHSNAAQTIRMMFRII